MTKQFRARQPRRTAQLVAEDASATVIASDTASSSIVTPGEHLSTTRSSRRPGEADTNTPTRPGSARTSTSQSHASQASESRSHVSKPATPARTSQNDMGLYIESETRNAIFHDRKFIEHFLSGDRSKLDKVLEHCRTSSAFNDQNNEWRLPTITSEASLYGPVLELLNTIKVGVHASNFTSGSTRSPNAHNQPPPTLFQDRSSRTIQSDEAEIAGLKPDLVLFEDTHEHWETVKMPIEIKKLPTHHKAGMKQLSRYARAVFAHQLHRRHLYGMMVCGTEATFVRFDRAGILYSPRIDLRADAEGFICAFASLLMLDRADEGYDTAFTTRLNEHGRLDYYINLPESAFEGIASTSSTESSSARSKSTRTFKVIERLCHRKSICGRATVVLRLREGEDVPEGVQTRTMTAKRKLAEREQSDPLEFVLKIIWRDPKRESEGEVMERLQGMFGLAQYVWHCDVPGRCQCPAPRREQCGTCGDETAQVNELEVCDNLKDIAISVPLEEDSGSPPELESVDTTKCYSTSHKRKRRIYSYILMSSVGVPLWTAESPRGFMMAVLDAILGYWRLVNLGILHRDISDGNVMMLDPGKTFRRKDMEKRRADDLEIQDEVLIESEKRLQEILSKIGRQNPTGMLSDFDLHTTHSSTAKVPTSEPSKPINDTPLSNSTRTPASRSRTSGPTAGSDVPEPKRRRTNTSSSVPTPAATSRTTVTRRSNKASAARSQSKKASQAPHETPGPIDFRTGTPAFMAIRVLEVSPGTPYHHNFLDDLESFFWLILWSAAAHLRSKKDQPTPRAQFVLDAMDQSGMLDLAYWKKGVLFDCFRDGAAIKALLRAFGNPWASDKIFVNVISRLGAYFLELGFADEAARLPATVFSRFVGIILEELA